MTPGIHPQKVSNSTIRKEPQPLPITDKGGNMIASNTRRKLIDLEFLIDDLPDSSGGCTYLTQLSAFCYI